jgi:hypothetical protein
VRRQSVIEWKEEEEARMRENDRGRRGQEGWGKW